jgi:F0F1-type ATP synthase assembly protein I
MPDGTIPEEPEEGQPTPEEKVQELQKNVSAAADRASFADPPESDEIAKKLAEAKDKIELARKKNKARIARDRPAVAESQEKDSAPTGPGMAMAFALLFMPLSGMVLGWMVDQWLKTDTLFRNLGFVAGAAVAILYVVRITKQQ